MNKRKKKPTKKSRTTSPILVEWEDHFSCQGWQQETNSNPVLVSSLGWIIKETPKMLVLAQNGTKEDMKAGFGNNIAIIKKCIVKRKILK